MKTLSSFEVIHHGLVHSSYFQGCGVSCTEFATCVTGIGDNPTEAFNDALELLASEGWDTKPIECFVVPSTPSAMAETREQICSENPLGENESEDDYETRIEELVRDSCNEFFYYLSIRVA